MIKHQKGGIVNILKTAAVIAVGLVALAGCQKSVDTAAVSSEIKQGVRDWAAAYSAGDADTIAAKYSDDAVVMAPGAPAAVGREAIREFIAGDSAGAKAAGVTLVMSDGDEVGVMGDLAWHSGAYTVNDASGAAVDSGNYLEVLQNINGKWMIIRDIWNSDRPPAPAAAPAADAASEPAA
jgi:ketosteroid isomerase-like protein